MDVAAQILLVLTIISFSQVGLYNEQAFLQELYGGALDEQVGVNSLNWLGTFLSVVFATTLVAYPPRRISTVTKVFLSYQAAVLLSGLMSSEPFSTVNLAIKNAIYFLALERLIRQLPVRRTINTIAVCAVLLLTYSILLGCLDPIYTVSIGATGLRGLFPHKNGLGEFAAFFACFIAPFAIPGRRTIIGLSSLFVALIALAQSNSRTAQLCLAFAFLCLLIAQHRGRAIPPKARIFFVMRVGCAVGAAIAPVIAYLMHTGDVTFTGRTIFWATVADMVSDRPLLGFGAGTIPFDVDVLNQVTLQSGFTAFDGSLILVLFNQGIVGLIALGATFYALCRLAIRKNNRLSPFLVIITLTYLLHGLSESSSQFGLTSSTFFLFTLAALCERTGTNDFPNRRPSPQRVVTLDA